VKLGKQTFQRRTGSLTTILCLSQKLALSESCPFGGGSLQKPCCKARMRKFGCLSTSTLKFCLSGTLGAEDAAAQTSDHYRHARKGESGARPLIIFTLRLSLMPWKSSDGLGIFVT
jgi:hypothetical protein